MELYQTQWASFCYWDVFITLFQNKACKETAYGQNSPLARFFEITRIGCWNWTRPYHKALCKSPFIIKIWTFVTYSTICYWFIIFHFHCPRQSEESQGKISSEFNQLNWIICQGIREKNNQIARLSFPWSIGWVALSFLVRLFGWLVVCPAMVTPVQISLLVVPHPPHPYIFRKLMIIVIQKWIRNTNTKTKTNAKTMTKTKTPREQPNN